MQYSTWTPVFAGMTGVRRCYDLSSSFWRRKVTEQAQAASVGGFICKVYALFGMDYRIRGNDKSDENVAIGRSSLLRIGWITLRNKRLIYKVRHSRAEGDLSQLSLVTHYVPANKSNYRTLDLP
jgi:hypothetical protein